MITKEFARKLDLRGKKVQVSFGTILSDKTLETIEYSITVRDINDCIVTLNLVEVDRISSCVNRIDKCIIDKFFPAFSSLIKVPPSGAVDILIGMQYAGFQPKEVLSQEHLVLYKNRFGLLVAGSVDNADSGTKMDESVMHIRQGIVMHTVGTLERTFFEMEGLGVSCNPKCGSCKCGTCHPGGKNMSLKEEEEYDTMMSNIHFETATGRFMTKYPWNEKRQFLKYNEAMAFAVMKSTERQLRKKGDEYRQMYSDQISDMLDRGAARRVTEEELRNFPGQKYFLTHLAVLKEGSKTTPLRIVFNSSASHLGLSLNDCLLKGPSLLNSLFGVLLRHRQHRYAFVGDLAKMFHSIDIPLEDQMMHLFLWRFDEMERPQYFAMTALNMGDKPSSAIAQICLKLAAKDSSTEHPAAADIINNNSYMDDILGSSTTSTQREEHTSSITSILKSRGFHIKEWIMNDTSTTQSLVDIQMHAAGGEQGVTENVLGMKWDVSSDMLRFKTTSALLDTEKTITRRDIVSTLNKIFDPLGLLSPFIVKCKIILRSVYTTYPKLGWDDPIPEDILLNWRKVIQEIPLVAELYFHRSITPPNTLGNPKLVIFSDGAKPAFGACAYARWKTTDGKFVCRLIAAKNRVAPVKIVDIVKLELCGAVLGARLRESITTELHQITFSEVLHIVDSEIVHAMVHKESYGFNTFFANRLGEIRRKSSPDDFLWIPGKLNISDLQTRGCDPSQLQHDREWQQGPAFLQTEEELWPVRREVRKDVVLPQVKKEQHLVAATITSDSLASRIDLSRFSKWYRLINTTARILKLYKRYKSGADKSSKLVPADLNQAESFWIKEAQQEIDIKSKNLVKFRPKRNDENIIVVGGRTERWMEGTWNRQLFILLPKKHRVSLLIARRDHARIGHLGRDATISKIRSTYWILGVRAIVKNMISKCVICKMKIKKLLEQVMAPLPIERLKPCPPFTHVMVDYFGPFDIKGEVQKRTRGKCYGVLFTCMNVRAVYADVAHDYSTLGFLMVLRRFATIRGWPTKIFSDKGSQLVGASNELSKAIQGLDWIKIEERSLGQGTEWNFSPANAPWYNGAVEALVKTTKKALKIAVGESVLSFPELQTCFFEAAELVNQRPIGNHPTDPSDGVYLSPNDLLLGRASPSIPEGPFQERSSYKYRFDFVQLIVQGFWKRWTREIFPNLVIAPKWHTERRNLIPGDIVLMQDENALRGKWKKALVIDATPSADGRVRHVSVRYRTTTNIETVVDRPIQRLILLVPADELME